MTRQKKYVRNALRQVIIAIKDIRLFDLGLAGLTGCLVFLSLPKIDLSFLIWGAYVPLLIAIHRKPLIQKFFLGWFAGFITGLGIGCWIPALIVRFGGLPWVLACLIFALLAAYQGLTIGFVALIEGMWRRRRWPLVLGLPVAWIIFEYGMPAIFYWHLGLTQLSHPALTQLAALGGPWLISALIVFTNGVLFSAGLVLSQSLRCGISVSSRRDLMRTTMLVSGNALLIVLVLLWGRYEVSRVDMHREALPKLMVGIVQGNVGIQEKHDPKWGQHILDLHQTETKQLISHGAQLVVWPESAYPYGISRNRLSDYADSNQRQVLGAYDTGLIFGALSRDRRAREYYNTAFMLQKGQFSGYSDKNYLLAFGEYIPFSSILGPIKKWVPTISEFERGKDTKLLFLNTAALAGRTHKSSIRIAPLICYEDTLPAFVYHIAKLAPDFFVNITNDAWFGDTAAPYLHLGLARFRSIEHRLDMVRAVNTGVSAHIDMVGRVLTQTGVHDPALEPKVSPERVLAPVAIGRGGITVFARVGPIAVYLAILCGIIMTLFNFRGFSRSRSV